MTEFIPAIVSLSPIIVVGIFPVGLRWSAGGEALSYRHLVRNMSAECFEFPKHSTVSWDA